MPVRDDYEYVHISSAATTVVASVPCKLIRINVNTTANATTSIYNASTSSTSTSATAIGVLKANIAEGNQEYGVKLATGLTIVTLGASDLTVVYANA